jgi:hypothetical protein
MFFYFPFNKRWEGHFFFCGFARNLASPSSLLSFFFNSFVMSSFAPCSARGVARGHSAAPVAAAVGVARGGGAGAFLLGNSFDERFFFSRPGG